MSKTTCGCYRADLSTISPKDARDALRQLLPTKTVVESGGWEILKCGDETAGWYVFMDLPDTLNLMIRYEITPLLPNVCAAQISAWAQITANLPAGLIGRIVLGHLLSSFHAVASDGRPDTALSWRNLIGRASLDPQNSIYLIDPVSRSIVSMFSGSGDIQSWFDANNRRLFAQEGLRWLISKELDLSN